MRVIVACLFGVLACGSRSQSTEPGEQLAAPDLVIGGADEGPTSFSDIRAIAVDHRHNVYVADVGEHAVRVFDSTGAYVRSIGRYGTGPGEFNRPQGLALGPAGTLFVYDPLQRRLTEFDSAGALARTHPLPIVSFGPTWEGGIDSGGRMLDRQQVLRRDTVIEWSVRRRDLRDSSDTRLPFPTCGFVEPEIRHAYGIAGVPFGTGRFQWIDIEVGTWCAHTGEPKAYFIPFGSTVPVDSIESRVTRAVITPAERDSAIRNLERQVPPAVARGFDHSRIPTHKPTLHGLARDNAGRMWMWLLDHRGHVLDGFSSDGRWERRLRLTVAPARGRQIVVREPFAYVIGWDSLDVPSVFRIPIP